VAGYVIGLGGHRAPAIEFLIDAYEGVSTPPGKGVPHAQAVADILRDNGADETTQLVGLLHDVVEDTRRAVDDVRAAFGDEIAEMVCAVTEDETVTHYFPRNRVLRGKIAAGGSPVADVALADKIATLRHAVITGTRVTPRKLAHYRATLQLALAAGVGEPLCPQLEDLLVCFA
jgi:(p)ppGpp synthase/HD superfamily hydrolase